MTHEAPDLTEDVVIQGHNYDGIREYDNPMPGWWIWLFWASVIWSPIYILGVHVFDYIPTYEEDFAQSRAELQEIRDAYAAANPTFQADEESLEAFVTDEEHRAAGAVIFSNYCSVCHGSAGEGLIGPNLTDSYWIHGSRNTAIFDVITSGVIEKGMAPWGGVLSVEERAQVVSFVRSLEGTNPPNAKQPEGTLSADTEEDPSV